MLAGALTHHEGALRASLQSEYGIRLLLNGGGRTEPERSVFELADYVEHLPAGCALGRVMGGAGALTNDALMGREIEFTLRNLAFWQAGGKGTRPEYLALPKPAHEVRAVEHAMNAKAQAWQDRHADTGRCGCDPGGAGRCDRGRAVP